MIFLASESPRRHQILAQMGIEHQVLKVPAPSGEDEPRLPGEAPDAYVQRTAHEKAERAWAWLETMHRKRGTDASVSPLPHLPVLAADTTVVLGQDILGKPANFVEAAAMLRRLSGTTHCVHTALVLALSATDQATPEKWLHDVSITEVRFKTLSEEEIQWYCATNEPFGKAGAYGIQGAAAIFVEHLSGSFSGVMGLPIFETHRLLQRAKLVSFP